MRWSEIVDHGASERSNNFNFARIGTADRKPTPSGRFPGNTNPVQSSRVFYLIFWTDLCKYLQEKNIFKRLETLYQNLYQMKKNIKKGPSECP